MPLPPTDSKYVFLVGGAYQLIEGPSATAELFKINKKIDIPENKLPNPFLIITIAEDTIDICQYQGYLHNQTVQHLRTNLPFEEQQLPVATGFTIERRKGKIFLLFTPKKKTETETSPLSATEKKLITQKFILDTSSAKKFILGRGVDINSQRLSDNLKKAALIPIYGDSAISGLHCSLDFEGDKVILTDLQSSNGTFVLSDEGKPVREVARIFNEAEGINKAIKFTIGEYTIITLYRLTIKDPWRIEVVQAKGNKKQ